MSDERVGEDALPGDELQEQLVAYLDGELSGDESRAVEQRIASQEDARDALRQMDQVWNALDLLPSEKTTHHFTQSTVAMVSQAAFTEAGSSPRRGLLPRLPRSWGGGLLLALLATCGFVVARGVTTRSDRLLMDHLPELMYAQVLGQYEQTDFLVALSQQSPNLFAKLITDKTRAQATEWGELTEARPLSRVAWTQELEPQRLATIAHQSQAFRTMPPAKREQIRVANEAIHSAPQAQHLRETALAYHELVSQLPMAEQAILRDLSLEDRLQRLRRELPRLARSSLLQLTDDESRTFRETVVRVAEAAEKRGVGSRFPGDPVRKLWVAATLFSRGGELPPRLQGVAASTLAQQRWQELQGELLHGLPPPVVDQIEQQPRPEQQAKMVLHLMRSAFGDASREETSSYFAEKISKQQQIELLMLPVDQMQQRLEELSLEGEIGHLPPGGRRGPPPGSPGWHPPHGREGRPPPPRRRPL